MWRYALVTLPILNIMLFIYLYKYRYLQQLMQSIRDINTII